VFIALGNNTLFSHARQFMLKMSSSCWTTIRGLR